MKSKILLTSIIIFLCACSQEQSSPYVETNDTMPVSKEKGEIRTH